MCVLIDGGGFIVQCVYQCLYEAAQERGEVLFSISVPVWQSCSCGWILQAATLHTRWMSKGGERRTATGREQPFIHYFCYCVTSYFDTICEYVCMGGMRGQTQWATKYKIINFMLFCLFNSVVMLPVQGAFTHRHHHWPFSVVVPAEAE